MPPDVDRALSHLEAARPSVRRRLSESSWRALFNACADAKPPLLHNEANPLQSGDTLSSTRASTDFTIVESFLRRFAQLCAASGRQGRESESIVAFQISLHSAAIRLSRLRRDLDSTEADYASEIQSTRYRLEERFARIVKEPGSRSISAEELATMAPWTALGLYARFLALHTAETVPASKRSSKSTRRLFYACLIGRHAWMDRSAAKWHDLQSADFDDNQVVDTANLLIRHSRSTPRAPLKWLQVAEAVLKWGDGLYPSATAVESRLAGLYQSAESALEWKRASRSWMGKQALTPIGRWLAARAAVVAGDHSQAHSTIRDAILCFERIRFATRPASALRGRGLAPPYLGHRDASLIEELLPALDAAMPESAGNPGARGLQRALRAEMRYWVDSLSLEGRLRFANRLCALHKSLGREQSSPPIVAMLFSSSTSRPPAPTTVVDRADMSSRALQVLCHLSNSDAGLQSASLVIESMLQQGYALSLVELPPTVLRSLLPLTSSGASRTAAAVTAAVYGAFRLSDPELAETTVLDRRSRHQGSWALDLARSFFGGASDDTDVPRMELLSLFARRATLKQTLEMYDGVRAFSSSTHAAKLLEVLLARIKEARQEDSADRQHIAHRLLLLARSVEAWPIVDEACDLVVGHGPESRELFDALEADLLTGTARRALMDCVLRVHISNQNVMAARQVFDRSLTVGLVIPGETIAALMNVMIDGGQPNDARAVNQSWRAVAWRVRRDEQGDDRGVVEAMARVEAGELQWTSQRASRRRSPAPASGPRSAPDAIVGDDFNVGHGSRPLSTLRAVFGPYRDHVIWT